MNLLMATDDEKAKEHCILEKAMYSLVNGIMIASVKKRRLVLISIDMSLVVRPRMDVVMAEATLLMVDTVDTMENMLKIVDMEEEYIHLRMVRFMMVNGREIQCMEMESIDSLMEVFTAANGIEVQCTVKVQWSTNHVVMFTKAISLVIDDAEMEC